MANFSTGFKKSANGFSSDVSIKTLLANGVMAIYGGVSMPASGDAAEVGDLLGLVTKSGLAFTPGEEANGINFDVSTAGLLIRPSDDEWACVPILGGQARYVRIYDNAMVTGASTSAVRFDLAAGVTTGEAIFLNLALVAGQRIYVRDVSIDLFK